LVKTADAKRNPPVSEQPIEGRAGLALFFVRLLWEGHYGRFARLRALNPTAESAEIVIDLDEQPTRSWFRRVVWVSTPH